MSGPCSARPLRGAKHELAELGNLWHSSGAWLFPVLAPAGLLASGPSCQNAPPAPEDVRPATPFRRALAFGPAVGNNLMRSHETA